MIPYLAMQREEVVSRFVSQCGYMYRDESHISKSMICTICAEPWIAPVMTPQCGHVFCEKCIHTWLRHNHSCPHDRTMLDSRQMVSAPRILRELVDELVVICSLGCGWEGRRDAWKPHLETACPEADRLGDLAPVIGSPSSHATEDTEGDDNFKDRWRQLVKSMHVMKKELKEHVAVIEKWKDKVAQLQLQLKQADDSNLAETPESPSSDGPMHEATCDFCGLQICGVRYKCLKCPDLDSCASCFKTIVDRHPVHDFVPIRSPHDVNVISLPEWSIAHPDVSCNHCGRDVVGPRYKCVVCLDYDLCHYCMTLPRPPHSIGHPMLRFVNPSS